MEYTTVLKNPGTLMEIDNTFKTLKVETKKTGVRRFCSHCKLQNAVLGAVVILTLISLLTQLPMHMQVSNHQKKLTVIEEKIKDLLIAYEIQMQQIKGTADVSIKGDKTGVRNVRTVSTTTPHFYLKGPDRASLATDIGVFIWSLPPHRSFDSNDFFSASGDIDYQRGTFTKVMIRQTGVYFVFAKVTANGRTRIGHSDPPPVGIILKKEAGVIEEVLDSSWVTQDDRGQNYGVHTRNSEEANFPMDSISVSGLYRLDVNDKIYIQVPDETINRRRDRFLDEELKARFGAFLVETCSNCGS